MICPYNRAGQTQVMQYTNELVDEESGIIRGYEHIVADAFTMLECPREGCAVWRDGRCCYAAVSLENE